MSGGLGPYSATSRVGRGPGWVVWDGVHRATGHPVMIRQLIGSGGSMDVLRAATTRWPAHPSVVPPETLIRHNGDLLAVYPVGSRGRLSESGPLDTDELADLCVALGAVLDESESGGWAIGSWSPALISRGSHGWQVAGLAEARAGLLENGDYSRTVDGACALLRRSAADIRAAATLCVGLRRRIESRLEPRTPADTMPAPTRTLVRTDGAEQTVAGTRGRWLALAVTTLLLGVLVVVSALRGPAPSGSDPTAALTKSGPSSTGHPPSEERQSPVADADAPATPSPDTVQEWTSYLAGLYERRAEAVEQRDVALLDAVYLPASPQRQRDANLIIGLIATDRKVSGFNPSVLGVDQASADGEAVVLSVRDRIEPFDLVNENGGVTTVAERAEASVVIRLLPVDGRWLIDTVTFAP